MTDWVAGMAARVVEHDPGTCEPLKGGRVLPAIVTSVSSNGDIVHAKAEADDSIGTYGPVAFWDNGWKVIGQPYRWRLLPGGGEAEAAGNG